MKKISYALLGFVILFLVIPASHLGFSQSSQSSSTVSLQYLDIQVTYPAQVMPGDSITVNIQATAKNSIDTLSLTAQVYYSDGSSLHQLASTTFNGNNMATGSSLTKQLQFTVPQDTPRTSMVAVLTESVKTSYVAYYYYPAYYNYSSPYCYYDPYWGYSSCDSYYDYYMAYPSYSYSTSTDAGLSPLSYVKATTPEYTALQSQNQALQQQLAQSQAQNQQLQQQLQNAQSSNTQKDATISDLNQRLNASQGNNTTYESAAVTFAILAVLLGALAIYFRRGRTTTETKTKPSAQSK